MDTGNYNSVGISQTGPAMNQSPSSNPGIVYQPANTPTSQGSFKSGQQAGQNVTYLGKDGTTLVIGNQIADVLDNQVGIVIYDSNGQILMIFGGGHTDGGIIRANSTGTDNAISAVNDDGGYAGFFSDGGSGTDNIVRIEIDNTANTNSPLQIANAKIYNSYFRKMMNLQAGSGGVTIWTGDGSHTPNAVLSGSLGDFLIGGPGGHPFYCTGTTNWTQI